MSFGAHIDATPDCSRRAIVATAVIYPLVIIAAFLPWRSGFASLFLPLTAALAIGALSHSFGTPGTRTISIFLFAGAAAVGFLTMAHLFVFAPIERLILAGQISLGILLCVWTIYAWRSRAKDHWLQARLKQATHTALLAWLLFVAHGCSADWMILGANHRAIRAADAHREQLIVEGRVVECWVASSPAQGPPQASVLYFVGKGGRADEWVSAVAWSWRQRPVEVWAMNYPGSGGSAGSPRLDQVGPDALAVYDAVHRAHPRRPIFVQGGSFGSTVALCVAARRPVAGLVLHNPPPLRQLILGNYGWWNLWLLAGPLSAQIPTELDSLANAPRCSAPAVFIMCGADHVIPPRFQQLIWNAYLGPKHRIDLPTAGHSDALTREASAQLEGELGWLWAKSKE
jgi:hypothetical protein